MSVREGHTIRKQLAADVPEGDGLPRGTRPPLRRGPRLAARTRGPLLRSVSVPEMPTAAPPGPGSQPERGGLRVSRRIPARRLLGFSRRARGFFLVLHRGSRDPWKHLEVASLRSRPRHGGPRGGACPGRDPGTQSWREQAGTVSAGRVTKPRRRGQRASVWATRGSVTPCPRHPPPRGMARELVPHLLPPSAGAAPGWGAVSTPVALRTRGPSEKALRQGDGGAHAQAGVREREPPQRVCLSSRPPACAQTPHPQAGVRREKVTNELCLSTDEKVHVSRSTFEAGLAVICVRRIRL